MRYYSSRRNNAETVEMPLVPVSLAPDPTRIEAGRTLTIEMWKAELELEGVCLSMVPVNSARDPHAQHSANTSHSIHMRLDRLHQH